MFLISSSECFILRIFLKSPRGRWVKYWKTFNYKTFHFFLKTSWSSYIQYILVSKLGHHWFKLWFVTCSAPTIFCAIAYLLSICNNISHWLTPYPDPWLGCYVGHLSPWLWFITHYSVPTNKAAHSPLMTSVNGVLGCANWLSYRVLWNWVSITSI